MFHTPGQRQADLPHGVEVNCAFAHDRVRLSAAPSGCDLPRRHWGCLFPQPLKCEQRESSKKNRLRKMYPEPLVCSSCCHQNACRITRPDKNEECEITEDMYRHGS